MCHEQMRRIFQWTFLRSGLYRDGSQLFPRDVEEDCRQRGQTRYVCPPDFLSFILLFPTFLSRLFSCFPLSFSFIHSFILSFTHSFVHFTLIVLSFSFFVGVFTQALKDAGFNNANATEAVTVKDATPNDEKVKTICDVIQIISGVTPTEGNTPPFGTALGNAVATAPSVSPDKNVDAPKAPTIFSLPELPALGGGGGGGFGLPALGGGGGGGFGLPTLPNGAFGIPALFDDGLSQLDPPVRQSCYHMTTYYRMNTYKHMLSHEHTLTYKHILTHAII